MSDCSRGKQAVCKSGCKRTGKGTTDRQRPSLWACRCECKHWSVSVDMWVAVSGQTSFLGPIPHPTGELQLANSSAA